MKKWLTFYQNQSGSAILLTAIALLALLGMTGLAIDGGLVYMQKSHLQKTANAAVLSGAQELLNSETAVSDVMNEVLSAHNELKSLKSKQIEMEKKVSIDLQKTVNLAFARLFGFDYMNVNVHAAAELRTMGRAAGAAPLGIDERVQLEYYKTYQLKVDNTGVEYGNFGVLALGDSGARTYEDNLRLGYQNELEVGDIIETQTGNIAGSTREVIQERINGCTENPRDVNARDCSRVILVPVYRPHIQATNQIQAVEIRGFAYFYITDPMDMKDTAITGMFIKRTGTGYEAEESVFKGAFSIRLTE